MRTPMQMRLIGGGTVYVWSGACPRTSWEHFRVWLMRVVIGKTKVKAPQTGISCNCPGAGNSMIAYVG